MGLYSSQWHLLMAAATVIVMPVVVLVWLYRAAPARYARWRNVLFVVFG